MAIYSFHLEKLDGSEITDHSFVAADDTGDAMRKIRTKYNSEIVNGLRKYCESASELDMFEKRQLIK